MDDSPESLPSSRKRLGKRRRCRRSRSSKDLVPNDHDNVRVDRISILPDCLILHILSFLPTEVAVSTAVLSTRWRSLWTSLPTLDLDDSRFGKLISFQNGDTMARNHNSFSHFVDRVFSQHNAPCIANMRLSCGSNFVPDESNGKFDLLNKWVSAVSSRNVLELSLIIYLMEPFKMPNVFFSCHSIVKLTLANEILLDVPSFVHFPCLKVLSLFTIKYANCGSVGKLLSGCPVLEELSITRLENDNVEKFTISVPSLKTLFILRHYDHKFVMNAPALQYLGIGGDVSEDHVIESIPNLIAASLIVNASADLRKILREISHLKALSLSCCSMQILSKSLPTFHNVIFLRLEVGCCPWIVLADFLHSSPKLHHLVLKKDEKKGAIDCFHDWCWMEPQVLPQCLQSCLKTFEYRGFEGTRNELKLAEYMLKKGVALNQIIISTRNLDGQVKFRLLKELSKFTRGSSTCQLEFDS